MVRCFLVIAVDKLVKVISTKELILIFRITLLLVVSSQHEVVQPQH